MTKQRCQASKVKHKTAKWEDRRSSAHKVRYKTVVYLHRYNKQIQTDLQLRLAANRPVKETEYQSYLDSWTQTGLQVILQRHSCLMTFTDL